MTVPTPSLSPSAVDFLVRKVGFVERLEVLVLLQRTPETWWSAEGIAAELNLPVRTTAGHLECLGAENVLAVRIAHDVLYRFDPGTDARTELVREIVAAYSSDRETVVRLLTARATASARRFADAFRLKRKSGDG